MNEAARTQSDSARRVSRTRTGTTLAHSRPNGFLLAARATALQGCRRENRVEFLLAVNEVSPIPSSFSTSAGLAYPSPTSAPPVQPPLDRPEWLAAEALERSRINWRRPPRHTPASDAATSPLLAARAAQGQIRCLAQSARGNGDPEIRKRFSAGRAARAADAAAADRRRRAPAGSPPDEARRRPPPAGGAASGGTAERLRRRGDAIAQRLFLMDELRALLPAPECPALPPMRGALGRAVPDAESPARETGSSSRRACAAYGNSPRRTAASLRCIAPGRPGGDAGSARSTTAPRSARFAMLPPGEPDKGEAIAAGPCCRLADRVLPVGYEAVR